VSVGQVAQKASALGCAQVGRSLLPGSRHDLRLAARRNSLSTAFWSFQLLSLHFPTFALSTHRALLLASVCPRRCLLLLRFARRTPALSHFVFWPLGALALLISMPAILVTGETRFTGSDFAPDWITSEQDLIVNLDKLTYADSRQTHASLESNSRLVFLRRDL
jgi:hypothetical protein